MAERKGDNQKLKMLYLVKIFSEETDDMHWLTMPEIIKKLEAYGVNADRKTLYRDIEELRNFGLDILTCKEDRRFYYYLASREFELSELKLLADAVQASKFITEKKTGELIEKLGTLTSAAGAKQLERTVFVHNRVKTYNEKVFYSVDCIHRAMQTDCQVAFQYGETTPDRKVVPRRGGARYQVSPWALTWSDENYYMIAYDDLAEKIKFYRVDKMLRTRIVSDGREGAAAFEDFDISSLTQRTFGMFGGPETRVTLRCENQLAGVITDRFGSEIRMTRDGEDHFIAVVPVSVSRQFFGWLTAIGNGLRLVEPASVRKQYMDYLSELLSEYNT